MNTSEVLDRAADLIEEKGWGKGPESWDAAAEEGVCIEGAILAAIGGTTTEHWTGSVEANTCPAGAAVREYLGLGPFNPLNAIHDLWRWNDLSAESQEQVVSVLRAAALIERAKENTEVREAAHV